ncbi:MAG TPA: hypothetical protein VE978_24895 [Chitinophagales bacterium]|nr:hypothetical protein [Chitinophagales bacterium]
MNVNTSVDISLRVDEIVLCKKDGRVSTIKAVTEDKIHILPLGKSKRVELENKADYVQLSSKFSEKLEETKYSSTKIKNFERKMFELFKRYQPILSHFRSREIQLPLKNIAKTIIVASKNEMLNQIPDCIPFQYVNKSGEIYPDTPFDPLLIVVNDFKTVKEHFIDKEIPIDTILFIGDNKYLHSISAISKNYRLEKLNHCIFIGTQDVETGDNFEMLKWNWTLPELKFFDESDYQNLKSETILHPELSAEILNFSNFIIETEHRYDNLINLKKLLSFIRKVYPITALHNERRIRERANEIFENFVSDGEEVFQDEYYGIDKDYKQDFEQLKSIYENIINLIKNSNKKDTWFKTATNIDFVVVPKSIKTFWEKELANCLNSQHQERRVNNLENISELIDIAKPSFDSEYIGLRETQVISVSDFFKKEPDENIHLFLSLYSNGVYPDVLLQKILATNQQTKIVCYEEEAKALQFYLQSFQKKDEIELRSSHREKLCDLRYPESPNINNENIDEWIKYLIEFDNQKFTRADEQKFEIVFEDETRTIERESKSVYVDGGEEQYKEVHELKRGERVRIYQNPDKETLHDIIKMTDEKELFSRVDYYSSLWKNALRDYFATKGFGYHFENFYEELKANGLTVEQYRLEGWLRQNSKTKFPMRKRDLLAIVKTVNHSELNQNIQNLLALKTEYAGRIIKAGFEFSEEINTYILTKDKGKMLTWLSDNHIQEIISTGAPLRTIKDIKKVDEELID